MKVINISISICLVYKNTNCQIKLYNFIQGMRIPIPENLDYDDEPFIEG